LTETFLLGCDVLELFIPPWTPGAPASLSVGAQSQPHLPEQAMDRAMSDLMAFLSEFISESPRAAARPFLFTHRAARDLID